MLEKYSGKTQIFHGNADLEKNLDKGDSPVTYVTLLFLLGLQKLWNSSNLPCHVCEGRISHKMISLVGVVWVWANALF